jgi:hypothetical protein
VMRNREDMHALIEEREFLIRILDPLADLRVGFHIQQRAAWNSILLQSNNCGITWRCYQSNNYLHAYPYQYWQKMLCNVLLYSSCRKCIGNNETWEPFCEGTSGGQELLDVNVTTKASPSTKVNRSWIIRQSSRRLRRNGYLAGSEV